LKKISLLIIFSIILIMGSFSIVYGWPWSKDMADQPSIKPHEGPMKPPENTLPITGERLPMTREELGEKVSNPVKPSRESIDNGERLYTTHCSMCHGREGKGDGSVSKKFITPADLSQDFYKKRSDGFIYGTIKNGGAVMPSYKENMSDKERWDVVNFIRALQGK